MSANARTSAIVTGASVARSKKRESNKSTTWLDRLRPYFGVIVALLLMLILYLEKGRLIAFIDHDISELSVTGELAVLTQSNIQRSVQPWLESSFLMADLDQIKSEVQTLPWVYDSQVSRIWPGKIVVNAVEQVPVVIWNEQHYLNSEGEVFSPEQLTWSEALISLNGPEDSSDSDRLELLNGVKQASQLFADKGLSVTNVNVSGRGSWELVLDGQFEVALGKPPFNEAVERVASVLAGAPDSTRDQIERMDTRYPNGLAIKWKEGSHPN